MLREIAEELVDFGRARVGDDLRTVVRYGQSYYDPVYTRDDIRGIIEDNERTAYRYPIWQLHRSAAQLSRLSGEPTNPEAIIRSYRTHHILQFPVTDREGLLISFDSEDGIPDGILEACKRIVYGPDEESIDRLLPETSHND